MSLLPVFFPADGLPLFDVEDKAAFEKARAPLLPTKADVRECTRVVEVGIFFDGTNNNMVRDLPRYGHTNIVRLFNAFPDRADRFQYPYYIPGVGTRCDEVGETDPDAWTVKTFGRAFAKGGWRRIMLACVHVLNSIHAAWTGDQLISGNGAIARKVDFIGMGSYEPGLIRDSLQSRFAPELRKLKDLVKQKPKPRVRRVNLSIFGFSRGAAQARVFANVVHLLCDERGGSVLAGVPIYLQFVGVFDTVASVGPLLNSFNIDELFGDAGTVADGHGVWATPVLLAAPPGVPCVHYVAAHEQRRSFPLDLMPGAAIEHVYPGVHSDVGGGYNPREEGRSLDPKACDMLARIACMNMYRQARRNGVPLYALAELPSGRPQNDFVRIPADLVKAFNDYLKLRGAGEGDIYTEIRAQTHHYLRWRGAKKDKYHTHRFYANASRQEQQDLWDANQQLIHDLSTGPTHDRSYEATREQVLKVSLTEAERRPCEALFSDYVHDSLASFMVLGTDRSDMAKKQMQARAAYLKLLKQRDAGLGYAGRGRFFVERKPDERPEGEYNTWFKRREPFSGYLQYRCVYPRGPATVAAEASKRKELEGKQWTVTG